MSFSTSGSWYDEPKETRKACNPFDFDEDKASQYFADSMTFGVSPADSDFVSAHEFFKKSMQAANMGVDDDDISSSITHKTSSYSSVSASHHNAKEKPIPKYNSADLIQSARPKSSRDTFQAKSIRSNMDFDISDTVRDAPQIAASEYHKLQEDLRQAKQTIELLKYEKWNAVPPKELVKRIVLGKPYSLDPYKSLSEKTQLLDAAIQSHDGNAILTVILFLQRSLKMSIFTRELRNRPAAIRHYDSYLRSCEEWTTLEQLYKDLLRFQDAALLRYELAHKSKTADERIKDLQSWLSDYWKQTEIADLRKNVQDEISLLETQRQIETDDAKIADTDPVMKLHPRSTIDMYPVVTTISYCALYHYDKKNGQYHPDALKKKFQVNDKQYEWSVLPARARLHRWIDIQEMLTSTGWLKRKGDVSHMGFDRVAEILHQHRAPSDIIQKYLMLIGNLDTRLKISMRLQNHDAAIDTIVQLRDRRKMEEYRLKIPNHSQYRQKINDILSNTSIKWR